MGTAALGGERLVPGPLPNFLIIGAGRSGSTSLHRQLQAHPEVFIPREKELHFFNKKWDQGVDWYRAFFADAASARAIGEATPSYLYSAAAPHRMASVIPDARLIVSLRNPVDRAYSHYWKNRANGREKLSFEEGLAAEEALLEAGKEVPAKWAYVGRGRYLAQVRRVLEHFQRDRLLVLIFEHDLCAEPARTYAAVCRFLGVDDVVAPENLGSQWNAAKSVRSPRLRRLTRNLPVSLRPVAKALSRINERPGTYAPMTPATRQRLLASFEADNRALASWLGRDLSSWAS